MKYQRHILLPNVYNFRDLGGYPAMDGRVTKWGILFRTDSLSELTKEGWEGLKALGVTCVIDLRSAMEREQQPVEPAYPLDYLGFSLMGDSKYGPAPTPVLPDEDGKDTASDDTKENSESDADKDFLKSTRLDYPATLFSNIGCAVNILDAILSHLKEEKGSIAFMCSAGKDRTGIVAALLLYIGGVNDEDIVADYMVSNVYNTNGVNKKMSEIVEKVLKLTPDADFIKRNIGSAPETMQRLLNSFRKRDILKVLADNGFGAEKQESLARIITE